jgi:acetoin utilization protein AcuB
MVTTLYPVERYMTKVPAAVTLEETVASATRLMRKLEVRHLPVVDDQHKTIGIVSDRDLQVVAALEGFEPDRTPVEMAMIPDPLHVTPETPLKEVAIMMASAKVGSCVVTQGDDLVGLFTTIDALDALVSLLPE